MRFASKLMMVLALGLFAASSAFAGGETGNGKPVKKTWAPHGAAITLKKSTSLAKAVSPTPEEQEVLLLGKVADVCQTKGCWMTVASGKDTMRVEFKDYGFFVPYASTGLPVRMQGVIEERSLSAEDREHIESESTSKKKLPEKMFVFVASGVELEGGGPLTEAQKQKIGGKKEPHSH
ncbi:MAG: DUF4920 domain-containing protein [Candidatus Eisenbacteria bacterium]|uniref:DUF4920 domain-containing protein n=1 Tax=Eiseniibacteriota bacterium TaxID=2212470 RepID=A0A849SU13_UNCEI|nr:DUF4920 domain-containing protein [Candidatus Eisenbacteria bacterium]